MFNSIPIVIILGMLCGVIIGIVWPNLNKIFFEVSYKKLRGRLPEGGVFLIASLIGWIGAFGAILSMLIFAPIIPDNVWPYFYRSYFIAMLGGMLILALYGKRERR